MKSKDAVASWIAFDEIMKTSKRKPAKIWVDRGGEFYNKHWKLRLADLGIQTIQTEIELLERRMQRASEMKNEKMRAQIAMQMALDQLRRDESIIVQPDEGTFRRSAQPGGQHAQKTIREAGVSDADRRFICDWLENRAEVVH